MDPATFQQLLFTPNADPGIRNLPADFLNDVTPLKCFEILWTEDLWNPAVVMTNRQAGAVRVAKTNYVAK